MKLYRTDTNIIIEHEGVYFVRCTDNFDKLINSVDLFTDLLMWIRSGTPTANGGMMVNGSLLPPMGSQEIWAAGVTYLKSREARMEEAAAGSADVYAKVYEAERPELFFKATKQRTAGHGGKVRIRKDSTWNVPEPELTLFINSAGQIIAYTIGNDMSSRSIEGENPLYLPQAKCYDGCASIGPCLYVPHGGIDADAIITMEIRRASQQKYRDSVSINRMKRTHEELAGFLFRECSFPQGVFLMTGTCLVPPADFTLAAGDEILISIEGIGTLINYASE